MADPLETPLGELHKKIWDKCKMILCDYKLQPIVSKWTQMSLGYAKKYNLVPQIKFR